MDFQKQSPIFYNGWLISHNKLEISSNIIEISQNEMNTSPNEQPTSSKGAVSRSCRPGGNGFQTVVGTIFILKLSIKSHRVIKVRLSNQGLPKQKKVDTFIYIIGQRVVYSLFGKGEVSNKFCVL